MGTEQRIADRVPFRAPLRVTGRSRHLIGECVDLSRTGVGIRLPVEALGAPDDITDTASALARALGPMFEVELNHEVVGSLVSKACRVIRIAAPEEGAAFVELGCSFRRPLSSMETVVLGVPLPVERTSEEEWIPRADTPSPLVRQPIETEPRPNPASTSDVEPANDDPSDGATSEPVVHEVDVEGVFDRDLGGRSGWRGQITGTTEKGRPPLVGNAARVDSRGVTLRVWRETEHAKDIFDVEDVVSATLAFAQTYGRELGLKLMDGPKHLWTGPAVVTEIALPGNQPEDVFLSLRFSRRLRPAELDRLGLTG